jgi:arginase family enzyme
LKLFGVALDPSDDPWNLELKQAWMTSLVEGISDGPNLPRDPYDAVTGDLKTILQSRNIRLEGKFPVPSWLWPKPEAADYPLVTVQHIGEFYDSGGLPALVTQLQDFVETRIFPDVPMMLGVDHAATMGVISALSKKYGPDKLSVIALDQHFDALPLSVRLAGTAGAVASPMGGIPLAMSKAATGLIDQCGCGNFWAYLMDEGKVLPQNLSLIGVADYPGEQAEYGDSLFKKSYLSFEERGCGFYSLSDFTVNYQPSLARFIEERIRTPLVYVSLDLDVGSYNFTWAARYMDRPGISAKNLMDVVSQIRKTCRKKGAELVGFDIMEFNMHFLGIEIEDGTRDNTISVVGNFVEKLT